MKDHARESEQQEWYCSRTDWLSNLIHSLKFNVVHTVLEYIFGHLPLSPLKLNVHLTEVKMSGDTVCLPVSLLSKYDRLSMSL